MTQEVLRVQAPLVRGNDHTPQALRAFLSVSDDDYKGCEPCYRGRGWLIYSAPCPLTFVVTRDKDV